MHVAHTSARPGGASAPARARGGRHARGRLQLQLQGELQLSCAARALLPAPRAAALGAPAVCAAESASYGHRAGSGGRAGRQCGALAQRWGRSGSRAHFPCPWRFRRGPSGGARAPFSAQAPSATASSGGSGGGSLCDKAERLAAAAGGAYAPSEADAAAGGGEGSKRECIPPGCRAASALAAAAGAGEEAAAAALLRPLADAGALACDDCAAAVSPGVAALLAASERCRDAPARARVLDARGAAAVRAYVVATCEPRAILVDACVRLVALREAVESDASEEGTRAQAHAQVAALEALLVTAPLVHALGAGAALWELEDAAFRQLFPTSFAAVSAWLDEAWEAGEAALARARLALEVALESDEAVQRATTRIHISARAKGLFSTFSKLLRDGRGIDGVRDLLGMRVVLEASAPGHEGEVAACYAALDAAREVFEEVPGRGKDYIAQPKRSGYSALHTTFMVDGMSLEVQVRGAAMHVAAESGAASHAAYKLGVKTEPHSDGVPLALPGLAPLPEQEAGVLAMAAEALASVPDLPLDE